MDGSQTKGWNAPGSNAECSASKDGWHMLGHGHGGDDNVMTLASQAGSNLQTPGRACACRFVGTCFFLFPFVVSYLRMGIRDALAIWRNGSASDPRSEGWEFESLCGHFFHAGGEMRVTSC